MGLIILTANRLCYLGCKTCFSLTRSQILSLHAGPGAPRWGKTSRVYLTWQNDRGEETTWNLRPAGQANLWATQRQLLPLLHILHDWQQERPAPESLPEALASLGAPAIGKVTTTTVKNFARSGAFGRTLRMFAACSAGLAFLFGCSFDLLPTPGWGWYAPAASGLMLMFQQVPHWLYREPEAKSTSFPMVERVDVGDKQ
jgi:hypothetical protein